MKKRKIKHTREKCRTSVGLPPPDGIVIKKRFLYTGIVLFLIDHCNGMIMNKYHFLVETKDLAPVHFFSNTVLIWKN